MAFMDIFNTQRRGPQAQNGPTNQGPSSGSPADPRNPPADPKVTPPNGASADGNPATPVDPLDQYKDIWKTPEPSKEPNLLDQPLLPTDPQKFGEAAKQMNFLAGVTPEQWQEAMQDPNKLSNLFNQGLQRAFVAASQLSTQMVEGATKTNNQRYDATLDEKFKDLQLRQQRSENPVLNHPSASPMLDVLKKQFKQQHPDKSPQDIQRMAETYLTDFAGQLTAPRERPESQQERDPSDFSNW